MGETKAGMKEAYGRYTYRRLLFIGIFAVMMFAMFLVSLAVGTRSLSITEVYTLLIDHIRGVVYDRTTQYNSGSYLKNNIRPCHRYLPIPSDQIAKSGYALDNKEYEE